MLKLNFKKSICHFMHELSNKNKIRILLAIILSLLILYLFSVFVDLNQNNKPLELIKADYEDAKITPSEKILNSRSNEKINVKNGNNINSSNLLGIDNEEVLNARIDDEAQDGEELIDKERIVLSKTKTISDHIEDIIHSLGDGVTSEEDNGSKRIENIISENDIAHENHYFDIIVSSDGQELDGKKIIKGNKDAEQSKSDFAKIVIAKTKNNRFTSYKSHKSVKSNAYNLYLGSFNSYKEALDLLKELKLNHAKFFYEVDLSIKIRESKAGGYKYDIIASSYASFNKANAICKELMTYKYHCLATDLLH